jgi:hypothetical protein
MITISRRSPRATAVPKTLQARLEIMKAIQALAVAENELICRRRVEIASVRREFGQVEFALQELRRDFDPRLRSYVAKYSPDQPRVPAGHPDGGQWTSEGGSTDAVNATPAAMRGKPWEKPELLGGFGGGGGGVPTSPKAQPELPFPQGLPPQLAPYVPGGKTSGILYTPGGSPVPLQSGYDGPAAAMRGADGYDRYTLSHVEGHAAALMRQQGSTEGTLYINNPDICDSCERLLPRMLAPGTTLNVVLPNNTVVQFTGVGP